MTRGPAVAAAALLLLLATACGRAVPGDGDAEPLLVAAASDLRGVLPVLARASEEATGVPVVVTYGSSGQLAQQLVHGAPHALFLSADPAPVEQVVAAGRGDPATVATYAIGHLAVWTPDGTAPVADVAELAQRGRVAIASPEHAPYGRVALEALRSAGVADALRGRLLHAPNVAQALAMATTGDADAAVVALPLARAQTGGATWTVPPDLYAPLEQTLVVTAADPPERRAAVAFAHLLTGADGRGALAAAGFGLPGTPPGGSR